MAMKKKGYRKGGAMKKKGYAMGGAMKKKGMAAGGKLKMVEKDGKKVPFFAADGKGKMKGGGMMKKKGMKKGGMMKKGYAKGGSVKVKSGDTLSQIAKSRGMTLKSLLAANPGIKNANMIRVGQSIKIPGAAAGKGAKSGNPYAGMSKTQMNMMNVKNKDRGKQRAATSGMKAQVTMGGSPTTPNKKKAAEVMASKDGSKAALEKARALRDAAKKAPATKPKRSRPGITAKKVKPGITARKTTSVTPPVSKPSKPAKVSRRTGRKAGGGMMMKKGMSKGGVARGTGAATRGKRFGRAG